MILQDFSQYLQLHNDELLMHKTTALELMHHWLYQVINKNPKNNTDKIIHREIMFAQNPQGDYLILGKSDSGRKLVTALINFAKSYENYNHIKWLEITKNSFYK